MARVGGRATHTSASSDARTDPSRARVVDGQWVEVIACDTTLT
jgi:hypothetical protein